MTANPSILGHVSYEAESSFGESSSSFSSRLQTLGMVDVSGLAQEFIPVNPTIQRMDEGVWDVRGVQGGSFTIDMMLTGHGSAGTGAISDTALATLLGYVVGNNDSDSSGTTDADGAGSATSLTVADATGVSAGAIVFAGELGDGAAEGAAAAVSSHSGSEITLLTALPATTASSDQIYAAEMVYPAVGSSAVTGLRFQLATANARYNCFGCYPQSVAFSGLAPGDVPRVSMTFGVSRWEEESASTFPSATATAAFSGAPVAAGSFFVNDVGTATRATYNISSFDLAINLNVVPIVGQGGIGTHQAIIGARRTACGASFTFVEDARAAGSEVWPGQWNQDENSATNQHVLYQLTNDAGRNLAFYFPNCKLAGARPVDIDIDGLRRVQVAMTAMTNTVTTSDLTLSNWRLAMG